MSNKLVQPPLIRYNLKDRGRKHTGVERNFDVPAIVKCINSPECQERVENRAMLGYLGHWVRIRFGLIPPEGAIIEGKAKAIEPAIVTTYLKAYPNGDVEHQTEFLDNKTGRIASRMFANKIGGFSSAINEHIPKFFGFDWVNDPNFTTNRGYGLALDSVSGDQMTLDDVLACELEERTTAMQMLLEASEYREHLALDSATKLQEEVETLYSLLEEYKENSNLERGHVSKATNQATLDFERNRMAFDSVNQLPRFISQEDEESAQAKNEVDAILSRMGY